MTALEQTQNGIGDPAARRAARDRLIVRVAAWFEVLVGLSFVFLIRAQSQSLFAGVPGGIGLLFARFSGVALIGLGIACLPPGRAQCPRSAIRGLFLFNLAAALFFAWAAIATPFRGFMLWPVVGFHTLLAIALLLPLVD